MEGKNVGSETEETKRLVTLPTGVVEAVPTPGGIVDSIPSAEETGPGTSLGEDPFNVASLSKKERKVLKQKQLGDLHVLQDDIGAYGVLAEEDEEQRATTSKTDSEMEDKAVGDTGGDGAGYTGRDVTGDMGGDGAGNTGGDGAGDTGEDGAGDTGGDGGGSTWADIVASPSAETEDKVVGDIRGDAAGDTGVGGAGDTGGGGAGDTGGDGAGDTGGDVVGDTGHDGAGDTEGDDAGRTWADIVTSPSTETEDKAVGDTGGDGAGATRGDGAGGTGEGGVVDKRFDGVGGTWPGIEASESTKTDDPKRLVTLPTGVVQAVPTPEGIVDRLPSAEETGPGTSLGEDPVNVATLTKKERKVLKQKQLGDLHALQDDIGAYGVLAEDDEEERGARSRTDSETEDKAVGNTGRGGVDGAEGDGAGGTWADIVAPPSAETNEKRDVPGDTGGDGPGDTGGDGAGDTGGDGVGDMWGDEDASPSTETEQTKRLVTLPTGVVQAVATPGGIVDRLPSAEETGPGTSLGEDPFNVATLTKKERKVLKQKQLGDLDALQDEIGGYGVLADDDEEEMGATSRTDNNTDSGMEDKAVGDTGGDGVGDAGGDGVGDAGGDGAGDTGADGVGDTGKNGAGGTGGDGVGDTGGDGAGPSWADIVASPSPETEDKAVGDTGGDGVSDTREDGAGATWAGKVASPSTETEEPKRLVTLPTGVVQAVPTSGGVVDRLPSAEETGPGTSMSMDPSNILALSKKERKVLQQKQLGDLDALHDKIGVDAKGQQQG